MGKEIERLTDTPGERLAVVGAPVVAASALGLGLALTFAMPWLFPLVALIAMVAGFKLYNYGEGSHDIADKVKVEARAIKSKTHVTEYDCANYEQTSFDLKMADEGVINIQDVSTCDDGRKVDDYCLLCRPILKRQKEDIEEKARIAREKADEERRKARREQYARLETAAGAGDKSKLAEMSEQELKRVLERQQSYLDNLDFKPHPHRVYKGIVKKGPMLQECRKCGDMTLFEYLCPTHSLDKILAADETARLAKIAEAKAAKAAARAERERLFEERRKVTINGLSILRPTQVPEGAVPSFVHGREIDPLATHSYVIWKWTEDGETTKAFKQPVTIDAYTISSAEGPVKTFYSAYDGEGRYVGDYSTTNGHLPTERHEQAIRVHLSDERAKLVYNEFKNKHYNKHY